MILNVVLILIVLNLSRCSLVHDAMSQNTLYVNDYCPKIKHCQEGTHVMCMHYDASHPIGQVCKDYVKIQVTPKIVRQILKEVNEIRKKLSSGLETGKDGRILPRAYGMMKMHWDSELATLAQVLADQCLGLKEDQCRATAKFSHPSQIITLINFKVPHWEFLRNSTTVRGLTNEKVSSAIQKTLKSLHAVKRLVTPNIINSCPALDNLPEMGARSYLKLIRGKATHIGCGLSGYTRYQMNSAVQNMYNSIQIVCNISEGPQVSQPVYTTDPPIPAMGFTQKCGCPTGYRESNGCLCETKYPQRSATLAQERYAYNNQPTIRDETNDNFEDMDLLPILEIQGAPIIVSNESGNDMEIEHHQRISDGSRSIEENAISYEVKTEIPSEYPKSIKNKNRNLQFRKMITNKPSKKLFKNLDSEAKSDELKREKYSLEDVVAERHPNFRENNDYDDQMNDKDVYADDNTFSSILDNLEIAVKDIELEGNDRELFEMRMRKIYESALKSKPETVKTSEILTTTTRAKTFKSDDEDFRENKRYLNQKFTKVDKPQEKRRNWSKSWKDTNGLNNNVDEENQMDDDMEQKDKESDEFKLDDKLVHIFSKNSKTTEKTHKHEDYNEMNDEPDNDNIDRRDDNSSENSNHPASRKQEKINEYNNKKIKSSNRKERPHSRRMKTDYDHSKRIRKKNEERKRNLDEDNERQSFNQNQAKPIGRKTLSYSEYVTKKLHNTPAFRRVYD